MLYQCWVSVVDGTPTLNQQWILMSPECTSLHNCVNFVSRFRASLYPCPETAEERNEMAIQVASRLQDLKTVSDPQDIVCLHHISSTNMVLCTIKKLPFVEILPRLCRKQHKAIFTPWTSTIQEKMFFKLLILKALKHFFDKAWEPKGFFNLKSA